MGGVVDGNPVNAAYTNPRFWDADGDDTGFGKYTLNDAGVGSGASILNIQKEFNSISFFIGRTINSSLTNLPGFSNNQGYGLSDDLTTRVDTISGQFHNLTGHGHTGNPGDAPQIQGNALTGIPLMSFPLQGINLIGVTGTGIDVSAELTGKFPSALPTTLGVVVNGPYNKILLSQASGLNTGDSFVDAFGNIVYGRLSYSFPNWQLDFFVDIAGAETAYNFLSASDISWFYQELFNPVDSTPVYSAQFFIPSDNATSDVVDATTTQRGLVNTLSQSFAGAKSFTGDLIAQAKVIGDSVIDAVTTGSSAALPAPSKLIVELTDPSLVSISTITGGVLPQVFIAVNNTGANVKLISYVGANGLYTGGQDIYLKKDTAALFSYVPSLSGWFVVSGSGGGASQVYPIALTANVTSFTNISELTFLLSEFRGVQVDYSIKEASSNKFRTGRLTVVSDGVSGNYFDSIEVQTSQIGQGSEGLELDAQVSGGSVNIRYKNTDVVNGATMECFVQKFQT